MRFISMFGGIGGFDYPLTKAGHECVGYYEIDKYCIQVYNKNFGTNYEPTDITKLDAKEIPDHDLLVGGFPCQAFSIAGKRKGFDDTRGTLFFEIARIAKEKRPKYLLLENVKGLLSHDSGRTFKTILSTITEMGYDVESMVLNSKNFGVPQNRERVFIIGHLRGTSSRQIFPIGTDNTETAKQSKTEISNAITSRYWKQGNADTYVKTELKQIVGGSMGMRVYDQEGIATSLRSEGGGLGRETGLYAIPVLTPDRLNKKQNGRRFKENGDPMFTLNGQDKHGVLLSPTLGANGMIRRLTPVECARLQGFPDTWHEGVSDTQAYKAYGNAVTTNVIEWIIRRL